MSFSSLHLLPTGAHPKDVADGAGKEAQKVNHGCNKEDKSDPLEPGVVSVEGAVKTVVGFVYHKYHDVPIEILKFVDRKKTDESVTNVDHRIPPVVKQVSNQALSATKNAPKMARGVASEIQRDTVVGTAKSTSVKYEPLAKDLYTKYEPVAEQYDVSAWHALTSFPSSPR